MVQSHHKRGDMNEMDRELEPTGSFWKGLQGLTALFYLAMCLKFLKL